MADWYVYQHDGDPLGPWSTDAVAEAMLGGKLALGSLILFLKAVDKDAGRFLAQGLFQPFGVVEEKCHVLVPGSAVAGTLGIVGREHEEKDGQRQTDATDDGPYGARLAHFSIILVISSIAARKGAVAPHSTPPIVHGLVGILQTLGQARGVGERTGQHPLQLQGTQPRPSGHV